MKMDSSDESLEESVTQKKKITPPAWIVTYDIYNNQLFPCKQPGDKSKLHYCKTSYRLDKK